MGCFMSFSWEEEQELKKIEVRQSIIRHSEIERLSDIVQQLEYEIERGERGYQNVPKDMVMEHFQKKKELKSNLCDAIIEMSEKIKKRRAKAEQELENDN